MHCVAIIDVDTGERWDYRPAQILDAIERLEDADVLIGHNIQRHDIPLLTKLQGWKPREGVIIRDTMICARVIFPNVKATDGDLVRKGQMPAGRKYMGKHTLASWGYRLGEQKGDYADARLEQYLSEGGDPDDEEAIAKFVWGEWNEGMHDYMVQDCETNLALWEHLAVDSYSQEAIILEHRIARVCDAIQEAGVPFDIKKAEALHAHLLTEKHKVEQQLIAEFGSWEVEQKPLIPKRDNKTLGYVKGVPVRKFKTVTFNPGSRDHIAKVLTDRGWKPVKFTDGGKPEINEEIIAGIVTRFPEMSELGRYLTIDKRISQLADGAQAWLKTVGEDGRIHGVINPMGTQTSRASHFLPNLAQVPKSSSPFGHECRELFTTIAGRKLMGADMSGLELRGLAHYLALYDNGAYMKLVVDGDPHWANTVAMGLSGGDRIKGDPLHDLLRDASKTVIYALLYGAGDHKLGEIVFNALNQARTMSEEGSKRYYAFFKRGGDMETQCRVAGRRIRANMLRNIVGFDKLQAKLQRRVEHSGSVPGLDGRLVPTRSQHSALNFLVQSCGAILCKRWLCDAFEALEAKYTLGSDFQFVLWVHDEVQLLVREGLEQDISEIVTSCARKAGEPYGFRGPLDSTADVGQTWADTH